MQFLQTYIHSMTTLPTSGDMSQIATLVGVAFLVFAFSGIYSCLTSRY